MKTMSYTESRANYAAVLDEVVNNREEIVITRAGHEPVVIVSLEEYQSLRETAYLLRSPVNAQRLASAMEQLDRNDGIPRDLLDDHGNADLLGRRSVGGLPLVADPGPPDPEEDQLPDPGHRSQRKRGTGQTRSTATPPFRLLVPAYH